MERFDANVCAINATFEQAPKVLKSIGMDSPIDILNGMIHDLMGIVSSKATIAKHFVCVESRPACTCLLISGCTVSFCRSGRYIVRTLPPRSSRPKAMALPFPPVPVMRRCRVPMCILRALPPIKVSSTSTSPLSVPDTSSCKALRIRCIMNHADFWVMPIVLAISQELTPFLQLQIIQNAHIHLSRPRGESSKMVPTLSVNCFLHPEQNQTRRVLMKECFSDPQRGQETKPFGQRRLSAY